jgi:nucleoredoxin
MRTTLRRVATPRTIALSCGGLALGIGCVGASTLCDAKTMAAGAALAVKPAAWLDCASAKLEAGSLNGSRVALYFAAGWCPMCTSFEPDLAKFRDAANKAGHGPLEIVLVSSEVSAEVQAARAAELDMKQIPFDGPARADLKKRYRIWAGREVREFGRERRCGIPALVVLGSDRTELAFIDAESGGADALKRWPLDDAAGVWHE